LLWAKQFRFTK
jgi:hypothetical protein